MLTFLSVGVVFLSGGLVLYTGVTNLKVGSWFKGIAFTLAGVYTLVAAKRIYDTRDITSSIESVEDVIADAEYEMFGAML